MPSMTPPAPSPTTPPTPPALGELTAAQAKVLALLCKPLPVDQVADVSTWNRQQVVQLAEQHGLRIGAGGRARHPDGPQVLAAIEAAAIRTAYTLSSPAPDRPGRPGTAHADGPAAGPAGSQGHAPARDDGKDEHGTDGPQAQQTGSRVEQLRTALIDDLLAAAAGYEGFPRVAAAAARVDAAVAVLRERLIAAEQARTQADADVKARAAAQAEVQRLRAELAAAEQHARQVGVKVPRRTSTSATGGAVGASRSHKPGLPSGAGPRGTIRRFWPGTDYTPRAVREWAHANGMGDKVPRTGGFLPDEVVEAALAAGHGKGHQIGRPDGRAGR